MCTLTFASFSGRLRVVFNRDEQRTRPIALPPRIVQTGSLSSIMPIDPTSSGTWIGVNSAGLIACLLNSSAPVSPRVSGNPPQSRGTIIPRLLQASTCLQAAEFAQELDVAHFAPFKVIVLERYRWWMAQSDGTSLYNHDIRGHLEPLMFASSGLGDELVDPPRRRIFENLLERGQFTDEAQDTFHAQHSPESAHLSVLMSREDARTVSRSTIELASAATMRYEDFVGDIPLDTRLELPIVRPTSVASH